MSFEALISAVEASHSHELALANAVERLDAFESRSGFALPADLRTFYLRIHRAEIAGGYRLLPVD